MTATNHVVTGALIVSVASNPWLGLPLAFLSHFVLDAIPHYGIDPTRLNIFIPALLVDMTIAGSIILSLLIAQPAHFWLLITGGVVSASPDLLSIPHFIDLLHRRPHQFGSVQRFLSRIQKSESVAGLAIELVWFGVMSTLLLSRIT